MKYPFMIMPEWICYGYLVIANHHGHIFIIIIDVLLKVNIIIKIKITILFVVLNIIFFINISSNK